MKIGIIGGQGEEHTMHMKALVEKRGAEVLLIDTLNYPDDVFFSLRGNNAYYQGKSLEDVQVFYTRSVFYGEPPYDLEDLRKAGKVNLSDGWYGDYVSERERQAFLGSWMRLLLLQRKKMVNPVECFQLHFLKPYQLNLLRDAGLPVPATLVTNNPMEVREFHRFFKDVVFKPVAGGAACHSLRDADLAEDRLRLLSNAPVIFQENVRGADIRVFVLDGKILCALEIEMETENVDFRGHEKAIRIIQVPRDVEAQCLAAAAICSLVFTGIDLKRTADGRYVILECNPSSMFIGFARMSGFPIDERLADFLLKS